VGGVNAALSEREKDRARSAPSFYIDARRSLLLLLLLLLYYSRPRVE